MCASRAALPTADRFIQAVEYGSAMKMGERRIRAAAWTSLEDITFSERSWTGRAAQPTPDSVYRKCPEWENPTDAECGPVGTGA